MSITENYTVDLLDKGDNLVRTLSSSFEGKLNWDADQPIQKGGKITVLDNMEINWAAHRLQIWYHRLGVEKTSLGIYVPTVPEINNRPGTRKLPLEILDKTTILMDDWLDGDFYVPRNRVVTDVINELIATTGETRYNITPSSKLTKELLVFASATPKLEVVNKLLEYINYSYLEADTSGVLVSSPHIDIGDRPLVRSFQKGVKPVYHSPYWKLGRELTRIPNKVVLRSSGSGSVSGLTGVALNDDPNSPVSIPTVGRTITYSEDVEAESQAVINALAQRRLAELSAPYGIVEISHIMVPGLNIHHKIKFTSDGVDMVMVVKNMNITLKPGSVVQAVWKEVRV